MASMLQSEHYFPLSIEAWNTSAFKSTLKKEIEAIDARRLPLQQGLRFSSAVADKPFQVMIVSHADEGGSIKVKAIIFYTGIIAGCSCADDPTPMDEQTEQCELEFVINKLSACACVRLLPD